MPLVLFLQADLDFVKDHWNTHTICASLYHTVAGKPDELYMLPENKGGGGETSFMLFQYNK